MANTFAGVATLAAFGGGWAVRANDYGRIKGYHRNAHLDICVLVQLESKAALAEIEAIAAVDGVDGLFIGPSDLAADFGHLGDPKHPVVQAAIKDAGQRIRATGKSAGIFAGNVDEVESLFEMGFNFTSTGSDVGLLARGGMGDVYRAADPRLGRDVALKTLTSAERGDGHAVDRFLQEARITASLDHPNIVKVFDVGMSNGLPYLVTELLDGEALRAPIGRGPVAPGDALGIASALTSGLVAAHAHGLVHRDLSPKTSS